MKSKNQLTALLFLQVTLLRNEGTCLQHLHQTYSCNGENVDKIPFLKFLVYGNTEIVRFLVSLKNLEITLHGMHSYARRRPVTNLDFGKLKKPYIIIAKVSSHNG